MRKEDFYDITNKAEDIYHIKIEPPDFLDDDMEIQILDGPLKGLTVTVDCWQIN